MASDGEPCVGGHHELTSENERLADQERDPAGADRDSEGEVAMTPLERHTRWLLRFYPAAYRYERGEEMTGTLLEASADRRWPRPRDVRSLAVGGLKARAAQNRQRTVGANLRPAIMAGLAMYLLYWVAAYADVIFRPLVSSSVHVPASTVWNAAVVALLVAATVVLAWVAPRAAALAGASAASVADVTFAWAFGGPAAILGPRLIQLLALAAIAALSPRPGHPSRRWLWLPAVMAASVLLLEQGWATWWLSLGYLTPALPLLAMVVIGMLWVTVDARLLVAVLVYFAATALQFAAIDLSSVSAVLASLPFFLVVLAVAAPAVWLLRRQSARPIRAD
jgi:hypothetical protein